MTVHRFVDTDGTEWSYDDQAKIGDPSGMGTVFRGTADDGRPVAVKRVQLREPGLSAERRREREVQIGNHLVLAQRSGNETSHLVLPLGYQFVGADLLIVMPLAQESLGAVLKRGRLELEAGVGVVRQIARGLAQLAAVSIVHRDMKPDNVLRYGEHWKITDFGLSKDLTEGTVSVTLADHGTPEYTAPELWLNRPATPASDLYALGVLAFEVLAGYRPFPGPRAKLREQHLNDEPADPGGELPARLKRLLLWLLAKKPAERPQDARRVVDEIDALSRKLRPAQAVLVEDAYEMERARSAGQAAVAAELARAEQVRQRRDTAIAELRYALGNAHDDILEALPDARIDLDAMQIQVAGVRIAFETREPLDLSPLAGRSRAALAGMVRLVAEDGGQQPREVFAYLSFDADPVDGTGRWHCTGPDAIDQQRRRLDEDAILGIVHEALSAARAAARNAATRGAGAAGPA